MEDNNSNVLFEKMFSRTMQILCSNFPPQPDETHGVTEERTMTTEYAQKILEGIADFDKNQLAEAMFAHGYEMIYNDELDDLAWVYFARKEINT